MSSYWIRHFEICTFDLGFIMFNDKKKQVVSNYIEIETFFLNFDICIQKIPKLPNTEISEIFQKCFT